MKTRLTDRLLRALAILVIVAAAARLVGLIDFTKSGPPAEPHAGLRKQLGLPPDHTVQRLVVHVTPATAAVLWSDSAGQVTAIVPDATGRLRVGPPPAPRFAADPETDPAAAAPGGTPEDLAALDSSDWAVLPAEWTRLRVLHWDPEAAVYITAGPDGQAGVAGVDDDGDGVIDNLSELGATGSDDQVIAPQQPGYAAAAAAAEEGAVRVISRGALVEIDRDFSASVWAEADLPSGLPADDPRREVWLEFAGEAGGPVQRLALRLQ